jgi:hypothetical protein
VGRAFRRALRGRFAQGMPSFCVLRAGVVASFLRDNGIVLVYDQAAGTLRADKTDIAKSAIGKAS